MAPLSKKYGCINLCNSNDRERLDESRDVLQELLKEPKLANARVLIFANKSDIPGCLTTIEIAEGLRLDEIRNHTWRIQDCSAIGGDGLYEGMDWAVSQISS